VEKAGVCRTPDRELRGVACGRQQGDEGGGGVWCAVFFCRATSVLLQRGGPCLWLAARAPCMNARAHLSRRCVGTYAMRVARACA